MLFTPFHMGPGLRIAACIAATLPNSAAGFLLVSSSHLAIAADIRLLAGSALEPVMQVLIPRFEQSTGHRVSADLDGAIGQMTRRIEAGEAADLVIVSGEQIDALERQGKVVRGSRADLAKLGVGVFVRKGASKPDIGTVEAFKQSMLAAKSIGYNDPAAGAPVSIYLIGAFERLGISSAMTPKTVAFKQRSERFAAVARGDVEIGFNQMSEILAVPSVDLVGPLPAALQNYTLFSSGLVANGQQLGVARAFVAFLASPASVTVIKEKGFE